MADETRIGYYQRRKGAMEVDRSSFIYHYQELSRFVQPRMGRYFVTDVNRGDKRYQHIINSRGTQAHRTARAGVFNGIMSPSRPWFKLMTPDPDMMSFEPVQDWLYQVEMLLAAIFAATNLYNMAPVTLGELLLFATGCMTQDEDFDNVTRFYAHTAGSYMLAQNDRFVVDTLVRQFEMTVRQLVKRYQGNVSPSVRNAYDRGNYEARFPVVHFVEPNSDADPRKIESKFKPFRSVYYEPGNTQYDQLLSDMGFDEFPAHCPRWDVTGEDTYGTDCPGMTTLGDVKGLQDLERHLAQAQELMARPIFGGPPSLRNVPISSLPGGVTVYDGVGGQEMKPIYSGQPQMLQPTVQNIERHERRINDGWYVDLFRSLANKEGIQPENELYLSMRHAEDLEQLGPVLERLHGEFLNKIVDNTFAMCVRANLLPPAPPELQGQPLRVRYISSLAMAMREVATGAIDKFTMFISGLVKAGFSSAADIYNADEAGRAYGLAVGVPPKLLVPQDQVDAIRAHREQQAEQQQKMAMMSQMAQAAQQGGQAVNQLATAPTASGGSALDNIGNGAAAVSQPPA